MSLDGLAARRQPDPGALVSRSVMPCSLRKSTKICLADSGSIPIPLSFTPRTHRAPSSSAVSRMSGALPSTNFIAFDSRFLIELGQEKRVPRYVGQPVPVIDLRAAVNEPCPQGLEGVRSTQSSKATASFLIDERPVRERANMPSTRLLILLAAAHM